MDPAHPSPRPLVTVRYCTQCRWLTRAAWIAQELLITFPTEIDVLLSPGEGGIFEITLDGSLLFSRAAMDRFPEPKEIKQAIRDRIDPARSLGHSDRRRTDPG